MTFRWQEWVLRSITQLKAITPFTEGILLPLRPYFVLNHAYLKSEDALYLFRQYQA